MLTVFAVAVATMILTSLLYEWADVHDLKFLKGELAASLKENARLHTELNKIKTKTFEEHVSTARQGQPVPWLLEE